MGKKRIVIAGSTGFIGSHLADFLEKKGHELVLLTRGEQKLPKIVHWDPENGQMDSSILENADVVINLCGENVFGRWSEKKKELIEKSRLQTTSFLCETLMTLKVIPSLYIGASAVGYYGDRKEELLNESSKPGSDFLAGLCHKWEQETNLLRTRDVRVVNARFGIVLGDGGALKTMEKAFRSGMGGKIGSGKQIMSWIALDDLLGAIDHVIDHPALSGPINFVAPHALSNEELTQKIGKLLHRPTFATVPKFALSLLFGEGADIFLSSAHALPTRLLESGFSFQFPEIESALAHYLKLEAKQS